VLDRFILKLAYIINVAIHADSNPTDTLRERRAEHGLRGDEAVRAGGGVEHAETQQGDETSA